MLNVVIGIGLAGSPDPDAFARGVRGIIVSHGELNAEITGVSSDAEWGDEPATWFAATFRTDRAYNLARYSILTLAFEHEQAAVAFTVGETEVAATPEAIRA